MFSWIHCVIYLLSNFPLRITNRGEWGIIKCEVDCWALEFGLLVLTVQMLILYNIVGYITRNLPKYPEIP